MAKSTMHVRVRDLSLLADIGINPDEIGRRQPLVISVDLLMGQAGINVIHQTVDYRRIVQAAEDLSLVHIPLIETFAERLGQDLLAIDGVLEAIVTVDKPFALTRGLAGVEYRGAR
jgi:dihydroneopterin aldolase